MKYTLEYSDEKEIFIGSIHGYYDLSVVKGMAGDLGKMIQEIDCSKFLCDLRDAEITNSTTEIFGMPMTVRDAGVPRKCLCALLVNQMNKEYRFLETISRNHGQQIEIFSDMDTAMEWLNSDSDKY